MAEAPHLVDGEPAAGPWRPVSTERLAGELLALASRGQPGPRVLAIDGRSASGKSTLAAALGAVLPDVAVVHTDDLAWHEPMFGWRALLHDALATLRRGSGLALVPPAWRDRGREGAVEVPAAARTVIVEGVGAAWVPELVDATVWVQSSYPEAERRGIRRDLALAPPGTPAAETVAFWHEWVAHERRHLAQDRPWTRADLVVDGTPATPLRDTWRVAMGPLPTP